MAPIESGVGILDNLGNNGNSISIKNIIRTCVLVCQVSFVTIFVLDSRQLADSYANEAKRIIDEAKQERNSELLTDQ